MILFIFQECLSTVIEDCKLTHKKVITPITSIKHIKKCDPVADIHGSNGSNDYEEDYNV